MSCLSSPSRWLSLIISPFSDLLKLPTDTPLVLSIVYCLAVVVFPSHKRLKRCICPLFLTPRRLRFVPPERNFSISFDSRGIYIPSLFPWDTSVFGITPENRETFFSLSPKRKATPLPRGQARVVDQRPLVFQRHFTTTLS